MQVGKQICSEAAESNIFTQNVGEIMLRYKMGISLCDNFSPSVKQFAVVCVSVDLRHKVAHLSTTLGILVLSILK